MPRRRLARATSEKVDAGVAILSTRFMAVMLHAKRQAREDMGFVVDGVDVSTMGKRFEGLYLAPPSRPERPLAVPSMAPTPIFAISTAFANCCGSRRNSSAVKKLVAV